jgi:TATA-binding protein-associated factor
MSDPNMAIRALATSTFATLIKLVPLEAGIPDPPGFSIELLKQRSTEREFLAQLLDGNRVAEYELPIKVNVGLRKYQRDGISWMAFLAKYKLHGILCDDMGLGKTLQSICILGSMTHERATRHAEKPSPETVHLPSLVVCPPTLTGHWQHEIGTYVPEMRSTIYGGDRTERQGRLSTLSKFDVVITSYDVVRNDIDALKQVQWHYCILDEGHIIKNAKTKLSGAVKCIQAEHRLILSGTPIQNNVLELWSLFDFLMPGFLGTEETFNRRFGKPIQQSRHAKSSSKDQEAGLCETSRTATHTDGGLQELWR